MKKLTMFVVALVATLALAGDDPVTQVAYTGTTACSAALQPKKKYAIQCTTDCYVQVCTANTCTVSSSTAVLISAGKLYDTPTTSAQVYLCAVQSAASGSMKVFLTRGPTE